MSKEVSIRVPVVCTRGVVVFPGQDVMIEVGRQKSINAVNEASASYDSMVWIVCQNDIMVDNPSEQNLYRVGTLSKIKIVRRKEGFMRVTFTGMKRAELLNLEDSNDMMMATIQPLEEVEGNHSSSAGKIGEKELFYIMSRGFTLKEAQKLMVRAKFNKILENIKDEELIEQIIQEIDEKLD